MRDPLHGAVVLARSEVAVADHPWIQRLRNVRQTGFSQLAFPGATHSRYVHSIGVMHLAGLAFDQAYRDFTFDRPEARATFRAAFHPAQRLVRCMHDHRVAVLNSNLTKAVNQLFFSEHDFLFPSLRGAHFATKQPPHYLEIASGYRPRNDIWL